MSFLTKYIFLVVVFFGQLTFLNSQSKNYELITDHLNKASYFNKYNNDSSEFEIVKALSLIDIEFSVKSVSIENKQKLIQLKLRALLLDGLRLKSLQAFHQAFKKFEEALRISEYLQDKHQMIMANNNIAILYNELGETELRDLYFERALDLCNQIEDYDYKKIITYNLALFQLEEGMHEKSLETYSTIYEQASKREDSLFIAGYWALKSNIAMAKKMNHEAIEFGEKCLSYSKGYGMNYFVLTTKTDLAKLYLEEKNFKLAEQLLIENMNDLKVAHLFGPYLECVKTYVLKDSIGDVKKSTSLYAEYYRLADSLKIEDNKHETIKKGWLEKFTEEKLQDSLAIDLTKKNLITQKERSKNWILTTVISISFSILIIVLLIRAYNRKLEEQEITKHEKELLEQSHKELKEKLLQLSQSHEEKTKSENLFVNEKYALSSLKEEERQSLKLVLLDFMEEKKPYLNPEYTLNNLADNTKISSHHLSEVLNVSFGKNFYSFMNLYRVEEAKRLMQKNTTGQYKLLAVCFDAGFNSRATFNRIFKLQVGKTPSEYQKQFISQSLS